MLLVSLVWRFFVFCFIFLFYTIAAKRGWELNVGILMVKFWVQIFPVSQRSNLIPVLAPDLFYQIPSAVAPKSSRCCSVWEKGRSLSHCGFEVDLISPALC